MDRLQFIELLYDSQHPIIFPKGHFFFTDDTSLSQTCRAWWSESNACEDQGSILCVLALCKQVRRECLACRQLDAAPGHQQEAPLPIILSTRPQHFLCLAYRGLDHRGSLFCYDFDRKRFYVLLFTCAIVCAVQQEIVDSLSAQVTLAALRRFVAHWGLPSVITSDNTHRYVAVNDPALEYYGSEGPDLRYIVSQDPWLWVS